MSKTFAVVSEHGWLIDKQAKTWGHIDQAAEVSPTELPTLIPVLGVRAAMAVGHPKGSITITESLKIRVNAYLATHPESDLSDLVCMALWRFFQHYDQDAVEIPNTLLIDLWGLAHRYKIAGDSEGRRLAAWSEEYLPK